MSLYWQLRKYWKWINTTACGAIKFHYGEYLSINRRRDITLSPYDKPRNVCISTSAFILIIGKRTFLKILKVTFFHHSKVDFTGKSCIYLGYYLLETCIKYGNFSDMWDILCATLGMPYHILATTLQNTIFIYFM